MTSYIILASLGMIISLFSMLLNFVFFFKVTNLKLTSKYRCCVLILLLLLGLGISDMGYKGDLFYDFLVVSLLYLMYRKIINSYLIINSVIAAFNIDIILDIFRSICLGILRYSFNRRILLVINLLLAIISCIIVIFIIRRYSFKLRKQLSGNNRYIILWLNCYLYLVSNIIAIVYTETNHVPPVSAFFITFLIIQTFFAIGIYYLILKEQGQLMKKKKQEELKNKQHQLEAYANYLEKSEDDLRGFRHDYKNILNSLKVSAKEGNIQEVIEKLDKYTKTNLNSKALLKYKDVNHVHVKSIKSIIISKLTEMYNLNIPYNFECRSNVYNLPNKIDEFDLVRIIGITFDNAIEESKALVAEKHQIRSANVQIMVFSDGPGEFEYEIRNKIQNKEISTTQIQRRGFTTKKNHKGLGLANIKEIENKYPDMSISYTVQDGWFDFYMVIDTEDGEKDG